MNTFTQLLYTIAVFAGVIVVGYFAIQYLSLKKTEVANEARFQCAQSSRYQTVKNDTTIWYPATELYKSCLKEKGL